VANHSQCPFAVPPPPPLPLPTPLPKPPTQVGNDFLPHIPSLDIYDLPSGLDLAVAAYKDALPDLGGGPGR
jgi:hypothetical protein